MARKQAAASCGGAVKLGQLEASTAAQTGAAPGGWASAQAQRGTQAQRPWGRRRDAHLEDGDQRGAHEQGKGKGHPLGRHRQLLPHGLASGQLSAQGRKEAQLGQPAPQQSSEMGVSAQAAEPVGS